VTDSLESWTRRVRLSLAVLPACLLLASCSGDAAPASSASAAAQTGPADQAARGRGDSAVPVRTAVVAQVALPVYLQAVGNVEAFSSVEIRPQVSGPLLSVEFREGQDVEKGQLLFTIDRRPFELALRQAQAQWAKNSGQSKTAETQRARYETLFKSGLVSQEQFDAISAQANSLQSSVAADQVQIDNAQLQLQYTEIRAPIAGRTGALQVHVGSLVRTNDPVPMVVINQITPVRVAFSVPASNLAPITRGQARGALVTEASPAKGSGGPMSTGALTFIDNTIDTTTSGIRLKATFPNGDRRLWPGEFVQVRLRLAVEPEALVVPISAVQNGPSGQYVYVVANGTVAMRAVTISRTEGGQVVVGEGLRAGEEVVTDGQLRLTPGARISVKPGVPAS
jgi:multidrug efflux system membrane fusion protein